MNDHSSTDRSPWAVFLIFLRLGLTSFGGPVAHLGYFRDEFVLRRHWLNERSYADLVALCQFLPGPASSQVGMALGLSRSGYAGALAAWAGFTLPSAIALILFAQGIAASQGAMPAGVLHGLKVVAVAVVAQAVWGMARQLCPDTPRVTLMVAASCLALLLPNAWGQAAIILIAAFIGLWRFQPAKTTTRATQAPTGRTSVALFWLALFFLLLLGLPLLAGGIDQPLLSLIDAFYRAGSLVFGGGHVVLPLLQAELVPTGWVGNESFLAGYGAAQAVPGPLFSFAAFLGAATMQPPSGWLGGLICLLAIFAPSFLLVAACLPFWEQLRGNTRMQAALTGINAAVPGLLLAALYQPVWTSAIHSPRDFGLALLALLALMFWKLPPWLVVIACGLAGALLEMLS